MTDFSDPQNLSSEKRKNRLANRQELMILFFSAFITFLLIFLVLLSAYLGKTPTKPSTSNPGEEGTNSDIEVSYWGISEIKPVGDSVFDIAVKSSLGNIRQYKDVRSFGLSNDRVYLATSADTGIELINLRTNEVKKIEPPFPYSGDRGEMISWNYDNSLFVIPAFRNRNTRDSVIMLFDRSGKFVKASKVSVPYLVGDNKIIYPTVFSPSQNTLLARTYSSDDLIINSSQNPKLTELMASLSVIDIDGETLSQLEIGELKTKEVIYFWGKSNKEFSYVITDGKKPLNYADPYQFTRVTL